MIYIGTDIISIDRIRKSIDSYSQKFLDKIFTESEINSSRQRSSISSHLAGKFAAKEAVKKAILSSGLVENISIKDIEVLSLQSGAPVIKLNLDIEYEFINVSISHSDTDAIASAIVKP